MEVKMNKEIRDYQESMFVGLKLSLNLGCTVCTIKVLKNIYFSLHCDTSLFDIIELPQYMLKNNK